MKHLTHPLSRYASEAVISAWSPEWQVIEERELWLQVLRFQAQHGVFKHVPDIDAQVDAYDLAGGTINLERVEQRERVTRHDVKARIEEFNYLASQRYYGFDPSLTLELIHTGMTSADIVDNISLIRFWKLLAWLQSLAQDDETKSRLQECRRRLPFRGIKGPVGTQQDQMDLLGADGARQLDEFLASFYGFDRVLDCVGQVYPRSLDLDVATGLLSVINANPWRTVAAGYAMMCASYSGDQWNEGDVSTSAVRRVALPGIFLCADIALRGVKP